MLPSRPISADRRAFSTTVLPDRKCRARYTTPVAECASSVSIAKSLRANSSVPSGLRSPRPPGSPALEAGFWRWSEVRVATRAADISISNQQHSATDPLRSTLESGL
jgi:hypothetical protein